MTKAGPRVDCRKPQGLLRKNTGRTVIFDSGRLDLDPTAQGGSVLDQGAGVFCGGGDGRTPPELCSAAGEVAGVAKPAFQGAIRDRVWAV